MFSSSNSKQYPIFTTAEVCFDPTSFDYRVASSATIHGPYPPTPLLPREVVYFGQVLRTARVPSAPLFASLSYFTRLETMEPVIPPHLIEAKRQTREDADAQGQLGPTIDDMLHFIHQCRTRFADLPATDIGIQHKHFDSSPNSVLGQPIAYRLGTLTGRWQGSYIVRQFLEFPPWWSETICRCRS